MLSYLSSLLALPKDSEIPKILDFLGKAKDRVDFLNLSSVAWFLAIWL
jgi:hypothetical protein